MTADQELVALYCEETKLSARIVAPFIAAGIEPPHRDVVDRLGFTTKQRNLIGGEG